MAGVILMLLQKTFKKCIISNHSLTSSITAGCVPLPYSPDLNLCDYFLWGYLKNRVYRNNPTMVDKLEAEILRKMRGIPASIYKLVVQNFIDQLEQLKLGTHLRAHESISHWIALEC